MTVEKLIEIECQNPHSRFKWTQSDSAGPWTVSTSHRSESSRPWTAEISSLTWLNNKNSKFLCNLLRFRSLSRSEGLQNGYCTARPLHSNRTPKRPIRTELGRPWQWINHSILVVTWGCASGVPHQCSGGRGEEEGHWGPDSVSLYDLNWQKKKKKYHLNRLSKAVGRLLERTRTSIPI